jgi:mono/diheme cytochrome c family protein
MRIAAAAILSALLLTAGGAQAQDKAAEGRGAMLYSTFCVACHTTQMHWRDKKIARDIPTLRAQVLHWQGNAGQNWDAGDIEEVVRHLNRTYYKFPGGTDKG